MSALRQIKQSFSPVEVPTLNYNDGSTTLGSQFNTLSLAPITPGMHASPSPPTKKKRSHGKAKPPGHIPRPPNAFIIFRTEYIRSMAKQNSTPEVSKDLGQMWRRMPQSEKQYWVDQADVAKVLHKQKHPEYKFKPVHRRDEFGNYIRKPRRPNRPRVKKVPGGDGTLESLPGTSQSLEGKHDVEFPNTVLPSDASSESSPPASPSPAPSSALPSSSSSRLYQRRPSSVPLVGPGDSFFGMASYSTYPYPPGPPTSRYSRRYSKRPSTSMDFTCASLAHSEPNMFPNGNDAYHSSNDPSFWRTGHRRSISAPDFSGELPSNLPYSTQNGHQEANPLTPIDPAFSSVFARFSWGPQTPRVNNTIQHTQNGFSAMQSLGDKGQDPMITLHIPDSTISPTGSELLSATTSQLSTPALAHLSSMPAIQQPIPMAPYDRDYAMFQTQMSEFGFETEATQGGFEDALGGAQMDKVDVDTYDVNERFFTHLGDGYAKPNSVTAAAMQTQRVIAAQPSDTAVPPLTVDHAADLQAYQDGVRYEFCPQIIPPQALDMNDLIVDGY